MYRLAATLLVVMILVMDLSSTQVEAFSLGQLFPASRRGVRGSSLIGSSSSSPSSSSSSSSSHNALLEAVRQAASGKTTTTTTATPKPKTQQLPVTNSPIYYIRLPPSPYIWRIDG
ncbi:hypothetical protein Hamer_G019966 [Homarus americanus]|uniref:Uncharacterized protein n=1 Tax=Homarus americanus TaxID=6706 RepID=A0A8J5JD98_HOMAM|nr:hypothetical protein Hamer_G019966 [Homarus americanus]